MNNLLIIGAGGHAKVVYESAKVSGRYDEIAFLDKGTIKTTLLGAQVFCENLVSAEELKKNYQYAFIAIGDSAIRMRKLHEFSEAGFLIPNVIHPSACISENALLDCGVYVGCNAVINSHAQVGKGSIINTAAVVEHDCTIGCATHLSPGALIGGGAIIGEYVWICIGACVSDHVTIGNHSVIAANSAVLHDVAQNVMVAGIPAKIKKYF